MLYFVGARVRQILEATSRKFEQLSAGRSKVLYIERKQYANFTLLDVAAVLQKRSALNEELANLTNS